MAKGAIGRTFTKQLYGQYLLCEPKTWKAVSHGEIYYYSYITWMVKLCCDSLLSDLCVVIHLHELGLGSGTYVGALHVQQ